MSDSTSPVRGVDFVTVSTRDIAAAKDFYGTLLGLPLAAEYGQAPGVEFETGNLTLQVIESAAFGMQFQATSHPIALRVDDVARTRAELETRGVAFQGETIDSGVCHMAFFRDRDGNALMLHHRYAPRTPRG